MEHYKWEILGIRLEQIAKLYLNLVGTMYV